MKFNYISILFGFCIITAQQAYGYTYDVTNLMNFKMEVEVVLLACIGGSQKVTLEPGETKEVKFTGLAVGCCLNKIKVDGEEVALWAPDGYCFNKHITLKKPTWSAASVNIQREVAKSPHGMIADIR